MGDLGKNSLWSDISGATDSSTGKVSDASITDNIVGPSYSYADHIPDPSTLGVGSDGTFSQLGRNSDAIGRYVGDLVDGDPLGNRFFVNTGGTCTAPDGTTKPRYNYVNNVSAGLIPGILEDIGGLNPLYLFSALASDGTPACECYTCQTTDGSKSYFLNPSLSPDFDPSLCSKVDPSNCAGSESFENFSRSSSSGIMILALGLLGVLILSQKK
jgi:hypothetical protein